MKHYDDSDEIKHRVFLWVKIHFTFYFTMVENSVYFFITFLFLIIEKIFYNKLKLRLIILFHMSNSIM